jgi:hypothetical protein
MWHLMSLSTRRTLNMCQATNHQEPKEIKKTQNLNFCCYMSWCLCPGFLINLESRIGLLSQKKLILVNFSSRTKCFLLRKYLFQSSAELNKHQFRDLEKNSQIFLINISIWNPITSPILGIDLCISVRSNNTVCGSVWWTFCPGFVQLAVYLQ